MPMMRLAGPFAVPGMRPPLRSTCITQTSSRSIITSTPNRRASEPSGEMVSSESQRMRSSNHATFGPIAVRTLVASRTADSDWLTKTTTSTRVPAARPGAISAR